VVILASPKTLGHSPTVRLVVTMAELVLVEAADQVAEQLATSLGPSWVGGQVAELVEDDPDRRAGRVAAAEVIGGAAPGSAPELAPESAPNRHEGGAAGSCLGVELVDQHRRH
jgi:hypothetical protein